ncbi:ACD protein, partial [Haliaeetus albicilla]|nr:ACD protein [Haliaeetus albicilla]
MQLRLSSLICRIIVLQKYTVCFREEARLEDCEFYLMAQRFIVLPMERQRLESSDGYGPWGRKGTLLWGGLPHLPGATLTLGPSISQLIDAIGQNQLEVLKENAEECLDLQMPEDMPATVKDEVPVTQWEAERKKEQGEDVFVVLANTLVIPPEEEEAVACDASKADTSEATPGKSGDGRTVPSDPSVISQASSGESTALSGSLEGSLDNPWNGLPPISLTLNSSDGKSPCPKKSFQHDVAADSNTPDLLEPCSQDSPKGLPHGEPVQTSSPSLFHSYGNTSPVEAGTTWAVSAAEAACDAPCASQGPQVSGGSQAPLPSLSPSFPVLPSSRSQSLPEGIPH